MALTLLKPAAASSEIAIDSDLDAIAAGVVDNENRIIALEEALGNVESMTWLSISSSYVCPENVMVVKVHPTVTGLTITLPSHSVGKKMMVLISGVSTTVTASSGNINTRGGGKATSVSITNQGEYEYVSDGVDWIDQSSASQVESEAVDFLGTNTAPLRASYRKYILTATLDFYLPVPTNLQKGDTVKVESARGVTPRVVTNTAAIKIDSSIGQDTSISLNVPHEEVNFYWDTVKWVIL